MTTTTLLATVEVAPYVPIPSVPVYRPAAVAAQPDDTVLAAWVDMATGDIHVEHRDRTLTLLDRTTLTPTGGARGMTLARLTDGTTLLAWQTTSLTTSHTVHVTTGPLTLTPGPSHAGRVDWDPGPKTVVHAGSHAVHISRDHAVTITEAGTITALPDPPDLFEYTGAYPRDNHSVLIAYTTGSQNRVAAVDVTTGSATILTSGPVPPDSYAQMAPAPTATGWVYPGVEPIADEFGPWRLTVRDGAGNLLTDPGWPGGDWTVDAFAFGMAPTSGDRTLNGVTLIERVGVLQPWTYRAAVVTLTAGTPTVLDLPLPTSDYVRAAIAHVATGARTAYVILSGWQNPPTGHAWGVTMWALDIGGADGLLAVPTIDGWWTIGTRDPQMPWELLVPTPLGWWVEIVAGEEHLADMELCVPAPTHPDAGEDGWVVVALMRPDTA